LTSPTAESLQEVLDHACNIADAFAGDWAIVFYDSTYPAGRNPDRPTRVHARPSADDPDSVPGQQWESGLGVQRGKDACATAAAHVVTAHRLAGQAVVALGRTDVNELATRPARDAQALRRQTFNTVGRLRWLQGHDVGRAGADVRDLAHAAAVSLLEAHAAVRGLMRDYEGVGELTLDRRCWNCQREPRPGGRECDACRKYRNRAEAQIRAGRIPAHRVRPVPRFADAHEALKRRNERLAPGQLDIEGPLPGGAYRAGEWTPAKPLPGDEPRREAS
jgi:hypothetical protein